jgi:hypothetical protein
VLSAADPGKQNLFFIGFEILIGVNQEKHRIVGRHDRAVAKHADAVGRIDVAALIENRLLVGNGVAVGVLKNQNPIPRLSNFGVGVAKVPIIDDFANPDSAQTVNIHVRRVGHHRLSGKQFDIESRMNVKLTDRVFRLMN